MTCLTALAATAASAAPALSLALGVIALDPHTASAAVTVTVNTTIDETQAGDGSCSLREATLYVNGTAEPDCASVPPSGTTAITVPAGVYVLTGGALVLTGDAAIAGTGAGTTTINAGGNSSVLVVRTGATDSVSGLTVTGGQTGAACTGNMCVGLGLPVSGIPGGGISNDGTLTLTAVTVSGNRTGAGAVNSTCNRGGGCPAGDGGAGGGISNAGTLTIATSTISGNSTGPGGAGQPGSGGGVFGGGGLSGNGGSGGAVSNSGTLTITNSTISGNTTGAGADGARGGDGAGNDDGGPGSGGGAGGSGGAIENSGRLVISASTISGNKTGAGGNGGAGGTGAGTGRGGAGGSGGAGGPGGGIDSTTDMTISNSTIAGNAVGGTGAPGTGGAPNGITPPPTPGGNGGGVEQRAMGTTLTHVTIASNTAPGEGGGVDGDGGTVTSANSILASNLAGGLGPNCAGVITDQGGNLEFGGSSCPGGFFRGDPRLAVLTNHGGPTPTIALQPGSAAIHHVRTCVLSTDQRGVGRPVGGACDAGSYQVAPPAVSGVSAGGVTTTSATIAAGVDPNLQDSTVVVNYGRTQSYGSSTSPRDLGAGNSAAPFLAGLAGLTAGTTYHFDVVATNADGQTTSGDGTFTTLPPLGAAIARATTVGSALSLTIACTGGSGPGRCAGSIRLTAHAASKRAHAARRKSAGKALTVAAASYSVQAGRRVTVRIKLNRMGRNLLSAHYMLATTLSLRGTTRVTRKITFRYPVIKSRVSYTWAFTTSSSTTSELTVRHIPRGGRVTVTCRGGGCPFSQRAFAASHRQVVLAPAFQHNPLRPGATVQLQIVAANRVGKVESFTIRSGQPPAVTTLCLPPGTSRPARCVRR